jgi:hypothetical protein
MDDVVIDSIAKELLCEFCSKINFQICGLYTKSRAPPYQLYVEDLPLARVIERAVSCPFCAKMVTLFNNWEIIRDGTYKHIHPDNVLVTYHDSFSESFRDPQHPQQKVYLVRLAVHFWILDQPTHTSIKTTYTFQRCDIDPRLLSATNISWRTTHARKPSPYSARFRPQAIDYALLRQWKDNCICLHGKKCGSPHRVRELPSPLRLIDVHKRCIVETIHDVKWLTLSYVWGIGKDMSLQLHNLAEFKQPGFLDQAGVPRTLLDAMEVTRELGETYLWIDRLCIVQDDLNDLYSLLDVMDIIYSNSVLTIVDGAGCNSNGGLAGISSCHSRHRQRPFIVKGVCIVECLDPTSDSLLCGYTGESRWNSRAWTLQETIFAPRMIIFATTQAYWQCSQASWCEDGYWEQNQPPVIYRHCLQSEFRNFWGERNRTVEDVAWGYEQLVKAYTPRNLTREEDCINAFQGVISAMRDVYGVRIKWGLAAHYLGRALCWSPPNVWTLLRRRTGRHLISRDVLSNSENVPFPSWSWTGWVGGVDFRRLPPGDPCIVFYEIHSNGSPKVIPQEAEAGGKMILPLKADCSLPTTIEEIDVPRCIYRRGIQAAILAFWTIVLPVTIEYQPDESNHDHVERRTRFPILKTDYENTLPVYWSQRPIWTQGERAEQGKLIVVARDSAHNPTMLYAILANAATDEGITYRRGFVSIYKRDWDKIQGVTWEKVYLA